MRIGSNLSGVDLTAQNNLMRSFNQLTLSSIRLSTMKRINSGSDDPAGLIAAENLRAEITAIRAAGDNAARAQSAIHVADSGLNEVSGLLNTIRGNVVRSADGTLSDAERGALQIETDAAISALNRIGGMTSYGGKKLLDGSAGFNVDGVNADQITDLQVHANASGQTQTLDIEVTQAATAASLSFSDADATLDEDVTLQVSGDEGTVALEFSAGATLDQIATAINASSENTGVTASVDGNDLTFSSEAVGSDATVAVEAIEGTFDVGDGTASGTDVEATVNGVAMTGEGNAVQVSTETLQADIEFAEGFTGQADPVTVSGGAMTFVFSSDVSQTSTLALPAINSATLGGSAGRLNSLLSGGSANLVDGDASKAMDILDQASSQVLEARTRAGAFEKYTIGAAKEVLGGMEENLSAAFSQIFDTDVAVETSMMIRSQILVESGLASVMLAGQSRGLVSSLLNF